MDAHQYESLTPTERRVMRLVHHSRKTDVIAPLARMSPHTVDQHIKAARAKLGGVGRYIAADMLRDFEAAHPQAVGNDGWGMAEHPLSSPPMQQPDEMTSVPESADEALSLKGFAPVFLPGEVDPLDEWLQRRSVLSRLVLVLVAALILLLLIVSAPLLAVQMEWIGRLLYR